MEPICIDWLPWCLGGPPTPESTVTAIVAFAVMVGCLIWAEGKNLGGMMKTLKERWSKAIRSPLYIGTVIIIVVIGIMLTWLLP